MSIPSNGITPEVIRGVMPPYRLSPDLMAATIAALPAPPPDSTTALREARLTRLLQEVAALKPADAEQAHLATQLLTIRGLARQASTRPRPSPPTWKSTRCGRLGRTAAELLRSAAALDRTLARHQQMPTPFYGVVIQDEVDIPALETIWASGIPASAAPNPQPPTGAGTQPIAGPTRPTSAAPGASPPPATPLPATALDPVHPRPDPEPTPTPATPQPAPRPTRCSHGPTRSQCPRRRPQHRRTPRRTPPTPPTPQHNPTPPPPRWSITKIGRGPRLVPSEVPAATAPPPQRPTTR